MFLERPISNVTVRLDPSPTPESIPASNRCDVADADRPHDLVPARRACEIAVRLGTEASRRISSASEGVLRREPVGGVLELEQARNSGPEVVLG